MYALVLRAADPEAALATLQGRGIPVAAGPAGPEIRVFGTRLLLERPGG
jgi:hypothetical protein